MKNNKIFLVLGCSIIIILFVLVFWSGRLDGMKREEETKTMLIDKVEDVLEMHSFIEEADVDLFENETVQVELSLINLDSLTTDQENAIKSLIQNHFYPVIDKPIVTIVVNKQEAAQ